MIQEKDKFVKTIMEHKMIYETTNMQKIKNKNIKSTNILIKEFKLGPQQLSYKGNVLIFINLMYWNTQQTY